MLGPHWAAAGRAAIPAVQARSASVRGTDPTRVRSACEVVLETIMLGSLASVRSSTTGSANQDGATQDRLGRYVDPGSGVCAMLGARSLFLLESGSISSRWSA